MKPKYLLYGFAGLFLLFSILSFRVSAQTLTSSERTQLEARLTQVQKEQAQAQKKLKIAQSKSSSLQNDINLLAAKIKTEQLTIQANNLLLKTLEDNIITKQNKIESLSAQISQNKQSIASIFQQIQQQENTFLIEILLSGKTLSQHLNDIISLESIQQSIDNLSKKLSIDEASNTAQKTVLIVKQNKIIDIQYAIEQAKKSLQYNQYQRERLLSISKNNEKSYSSLVAKKKKEAQAIKARLFALAGGSNPIPFGVAYQYALLAQKKTGVKPAFLLAIMTQESNLGKNQGTCYLVNTSTGSGVSIRSGHFLKKVMSPKRDVPPFLKITSALNIDPFHTVVSCPQSVGWGGSMGPAQFIASTWMLFTHRVSSALGFSGMANPWNPKHAFIASALYLSDLGASKGGYTAEKNAACRYYSGSSCSKSSLISSYGRSVMYLASKIQRTEIDKL